MSSKAGEPGGENGPLGDAEGEIDQPATPEQIWLDSNCDPAKLKAQPANFNYTPQGAAVRHQQLMQSELSISDAVSAEVQQANLGLLKIAKSGTVGVQQVHAQKIEIEALNIVRFQQVFAQEIFLKTALVSSGNLQQIAAGTPHLYVEADAIDGAVQQVKALCLATHSVQTIQQVLSAHVVGRPLGTARAGIGKVQQLYRVHIEDADVGEIQQVNEVVLRNVHVDKVQQVHKLRLINSTVGETHQVGQILNQ